MQKTIGIIGFGNMGSAIAEQLKADYSIIVFDKDKSKLKDLQGIEVTQNNIDLIDKVDTVILAIKPQDFDTALEEIKDHIKNKLIISIAAGITTNYIEKKISKVRVIRVMPNIGAKIKESETFLCKGTFATNDDLAFAQDLFNHLGKTWIVEEKMINPSTAISGSGPAYIYYDIEINNLDPFDLSEQKKNEYIRRLAEAAKSVGFNSKDADDLAVNVTYTSINLIKKTRLSTSQLMKQITSKGGTTQAALEVIQQGGFWKQAAEAALRRAEELSKKE